MTQTVWSNGLVPAAASASNRPRIAALGVREADRGRQALAQRAGGDLHAGGVLVLRVARGQRAPGPQRLQVLQFQAVAGEEQLDVQGQGRVPGGEDEPVAAQPVRILPGRGASASGREGTRPEPGSSPSPGGRCRPSPPHPRPGHGRCPRRAGPSSVHDSSCSSKCGTKTGPLSVLTAGGTLSPARGTVRCPLRYVPAVHHRNVDLSFRRRCRAAAFRQVAVNGVPVRADLLTA